MTNSQGPLAVLVAFALCRSAAIVLALSTAAAVAQTSIDEAREAFAIADDRRAVVERLLPGSEARAYYEALLALHEGRWDAFDALAAAWDRRKKEDARFEALVGRRMLLGFRADPERTWKHLVDELAPKLDHRSPAEAAAQVPPSRVDPAELRDEAFARRALESDSWPFGRMSEAERRAVPIAELSPTSRRDFLRHLERPDVPGLVAAIAQDLEFGDAVSFGDRTIHSRLTLRQMDELASARPEVLIHERFVAGYLARLAPSPDEAWRSDDGLYAAFLDRLTAFAARLPRAYDPLRAELLQHRLLLEHRRGTATPERLREYLRVARGAAYLHPNVREERRASSRDEASTGLEPIGLQPIGNDAAFVRELMIEFLQAGAIAEPFEGLLDPDWLLQVRAEAALLRGDAIVPAWMERLGPAFLAALEQRVDLRFPAGNPRALAADDPVRIEVETKNVDALVVKVFEIDAFDFYRERRRPLDAHIDLDAVVPHRSERIAIEAPPARRVRHTVEFPDLAEPGTYVLEFSGGGVASRVLVEKGHLELVERIGAAGHVLHVVDERGERLADASVWFEGRELAPDARGECLLPFATAPGPKSLILRHGRRAALASVEHVAEAYSLSAFVHLDREVLLPGRAAPILVRPRLDVHGARVSLALLEDAVLTLVSTRHDGVRATRSVRDLALRNDAELVVEYDVPLDTARLEVQLAGRVRQLADGELADVRSTLSAFDIGAHMAPEDLVQPYLARPYLVRDGTAVRVELRGPNGEPKPGVPVQVVLESARSATPYRASLASDAAGHVHVGEAMHLAALTVRVEGKPAVRWRLSESATPWPGSVHAPAGSTLRLPVPLDFAPRARDVSVLEVRGGEFAREAGANARHEPGALVLAGLGPGDYDVAVPVLGLATTVRVARVATAAGAAPNVAVNAARRLELSPPLLSIRALAARDRTVEVAVRDADPTARVHLVARRFFPESDAAARLESRLSRAVDHSGIETRTLEYLAQRPIGDEQRYILARRFAPRFLGNLLERRGLLLHAWASDETGPRSTEIGIGGGGGGGGRRGRRGTHRGPGDTVPRSGDTNAHSDFAFLPDPARMLVNLRPDASGVVRVSFDDLGLDAGLHHVEAIAVDRSGAQRAQIALATVPFQPADRRLAEALPSGGVWGEERRIELVRAGETLEAATQGVRRRAIGGLADMFAAFQSLSDEPEFRRFEFLTRWSAFTREQKLAHYDQFACHELHVFLRLQDRPFFDEVVRPYLANKGERTFLDAWLLDGDVRPWLETKRFEALNTAERVLLLERLGEPAERIVRELDHALKREPLDRDDLRRRFEAALLGVAGGSIADASDSEAAAGRVRAPSSGPRTGSGSRAAAAKEAVEERDAAVTDIPFEHPGELDIDVVRRSTVRGLARPLGPTRRLVETHWWRTRLTDGSPKTSALRFWRDYALRDRTTPFLSVHILEATGSVSERLLALAVSDFASGVDDAFERDGATARARVDVLLLARRIAAMAGTSSPQPLLVAAEVEPAKGTASATNAGAGALVAGVPYRMRVVVTNPTPRAHVAEVLVQVPAGAVALDGLGETRSTPLEIAPWTTRPIEALFYFPAAGDFAHGPAHVRVDGAGAYRSEPEVLTVLAAAPVEDDGSFENLAARGDADLVLAALRERDLAGVELGRIAWRMADPEFFTAATEVLRSRFVYHQGLWAYALLHRDTRATAEHLARTGLASAVGPWLRSDLLDVDPFADRALEFAEFAPRVNSRAHPEAGIAGVRDGRVEARYRELLRIWELKPALEPRDRLELAYHMLLQERIEGALSQLGRVERGAVTTALQHDYMLAHAAFFSGDLATARRLAEPHRDHSVARWRELFRGVLEVADAAEGRAPLGETQEGAPASPPLLELALERDVVGVVHAGLREVEVNFYSIDLEFQFSADPFGGMGGEGTGHVRPHASLRAPGAHERTRSELAIPPELATASLIVEARGAGIVRRVLHQPSALSVDFAEQSGRLVARDGERPAAGVYVKVYSRQASGAVQFHKDGYTDILGRFDYASVSGVRHEISRFAILVLDERRGAVVRDVAPPPR